MTDPVLDLSSPRITDDTRERIRLKRYEQWERYLLSTKAEPDEGILDLGGSLGYTASYALLNLPHSCVLSVEPDPSLVPILKQNVSLQPNGPARHVTLFGGMYATDGVVHYVAERSTDAGRLGTQGGVHVPAHRLITVYRRFCDHFGRTPTMLLMDIEGHEHDVFSDPQSAEILRSIKKIVIEFHSKLIGVERCQQIRSQLSVHHEVKWRRYGTYYYERIDSA